MSTVIITENLGVFEEFLSRYAVLKLLSGDVDIAFAGLFVCALASGAAAGLFV